MTTRITDDVVERVLAETLLAAGTRLHEWRLRSIHHRGRSSTSILVEGDVTDHTDRDRTLLYVLHTSTRDVPDHGAVVEVGGTPVHVWQFPDDPYLPGLRTAVSRRAAAHRLLRLGLASTGSGRPGIHTRSYRPTRRAVVELTAPGASSPTLYLKVLGGRSRARVHDRASTLVAVHDHLAAHLPVPRVVEHDLDAGIVALERRGGRTLRQLLRSGGELPSPDDVAALVARIAATPAPPGDNDPSAYADVSRHVALLRDAVPDRAAALDDIATAVTGVGGPRGTLHGDLHDGQLLVEDRELAGLLDVDGAGAGPLAHDAGRLVANVEVQALSAPAHAAATERFAAQLTERLVGPIGMEHLARAAASAWVGLATGPHRVRGPGWRDATRARIDRGVRWLDVA